MTNEWQQFKLGKICIKIGSGATPSGGKDAYRGGNTALIRSQNIHNNRFSRDGIVYINDNQAHDLRNVIVEQNDVLLNITGDSVARCCQVDPDILPARVNQHVAIIRTQPNLLDPRFLRYVLVSPSMQNHLLSLASAGATRNALTKTMIESLIINAPSIEKQRRIADILGTLDDKIELNQRMNATLEAMARALFKSWFVDFEPVRAKLDGRWQRGQSLPGLPAHLYDLFPDQLVDSELGEIPKGGGVGKVGDIIKRLSVGKKYEQKTVNNQGLVPVLDQGKSGIIGFHNNEPGVIATQQMPVIVFANHTCYMRIVDFPFSTIQNVLPFVGKNLPTLWVYHATIGKQSFIEYKGHWPDFILHEIAIPQLNLAKAFSKIVSSYLMQIWRNEQEAYTLTDLRNTLLPKLLSGEVEV